MIALHRVATDRGEVAVDLHRADGSVSYRKGGAFQTWVDAQGRNLAGHIDQAVDLFVRDGARRVLVLGYGGGMASTLLRRKGVVVDAVDCDPCAEALARLFFRASPDVNVTVSDAWDYVRAAPSASVDGVLVDIQDTGVTPPAYRSLAFWRDVARLIRMGGLIVLNVVDSLFDSADWADVRKALAAAGLDTAAISDDFGQGNRLLVTAAD